jgi:hypothetical protein
MKEEKRQNLPTPYPNCLVIRPVKQGGVSYEYIEDPPGQPWIFRGHPTYCATQSNGALEAFEPPDKINCLPDKLYRGLHWEPTRRLLAYRPTMLDKVNMWLGVILVGILVFIIFLILNP